MKVTYKGLWKLLIEKGLQKQDLVKYAGLSSATVAKMGRGEPVSNKVLEKICDYITFMHQGRITLSDSKDALLERYVIVRCTAEDLAALPKEAVAGIRRHAFGVEALVLREAVSKDMVTDRASLEDIMLFMVKEGRI